MSGSLSLINNRLAYGRKNRRSLTSCLYADEVTDFIAKKIAAAHPEMDVASRGPFGLFAQCSVSVKLGEDLVGFLTVREGRDGCFEYVDYASPEKNTYPKDSIGDMNGGNLVVHPLPVDMKKVFELAFK